MSKPIPANALIVVADGGKAILFRNTGHGDTLSLAEEQRLTPATLTQGPSGARPGEQSPKQTGEATFAKDLAHTLFTMHEQKQFQDMVLIADPQTLGQIRSAMHKSVEAAVHHTVAKDYTNHSLAQIEHALTS